MKAQIGDYVMWTGIADRLVGKVRDLSPWGKANVCLLHGGVRTVDVSRLSVVTDHWVDWAVSLGGTTVPKTGQPPTD